MDNQTIRIAQVMGKMVGGGLESSVLNYYSAIRKDRINYDFIVDSDSTWIPRSFIESRGGRVIEVPPYQSPIEYQRVLRALFESEHYPVVHSHLNTLSVFPLRAAKKAGVPVRIAHSHATMGKGEMKRNTLKRILRLFSNIYPTDRVACSKYAGTWLFGKKQEYLVIPNAIDLDAFSYDQKINMSLRKSLNINVNDIVIGHVGRLEKTKNQPFLLEVFRQIKMVYENAKLVLVGEGKQRGLLENIVFQMGLKESVLFLGQRSDISDIYQTFDLFLFPSLYEGFGMALLEAQKSGVTCIASDRITDEVVLCDWCWRASIDSGVEKWVELSERALGQSGIDRQLRSSSDVFDAYDLCRTAAKLEEYYCKLVDSLK